MKTGRTIPFSALEHVQDAIALVLRVRFAECLERNAALSGEDAEAMHAFRLACKRLRYAIERFESDVPQLEGAARFLSRMTDELGAAHDCAILAELGGECNAPSAVTRAREDRERYVARARRLWRRGFQKRGALGPLADYTGFRWELAP